MKPQSPTFIACPRHPDWHTQALEREIYGRVPLPFEPCLAGNCGQAGAATKFVSRGAGYSLFLAETEAVLAFDRPRPGPGAVDARLRMKLVGANRALRVRAAKKLSGRMNYFIGNDPKKWRTSVSTYAEVRYENVYPGIDVVFYGKQGQLEYDFIVAPGADPKVIRFELSGADQTKLDDNGDLLVAGASGEIRLRAPVIYQEADGGREEIPGRYVLEGAGRVRFEVGAYDSARPLVIDPVLYYYTYLYVPNVGAMAVDGSGDVYLTGQCGGVAAFVAKVKPATSELVYLAHLGNYNADNFGTGISVDAFGNAYVTGWTTARDFPVVNAVQPIKPTPSGPSAFVAKLDPTGSSLLYSTYLGQPPRPSRSRTDREGAFTRGWGIAVDASGSVCVTGWTTSTANPSGTLGDGDTKAFVSKLSPAGSSLLYSTHLGGTGGDAGRGIAADAAGNCYVTGYTESPGFPTTPGAFRTTGAGVFVAKLSPAGSVVYSTLLGSGRGDAIAVDASNNTYVTGGTDSDSFPLVKAIQPALASGTFFKSTDRGDSWAKISNGLSSSTVWALAFDPVNPAILYAGTKHGVFKTTDAGASWKPMNNGLPGSRTVRALAIDPTAPTIVYAAIGSFGIEPPLGGFFKSTDGGGSWQPMDGLPKQFAFALVIDPSQPLTLYAAGPAVFKSTDGGKSWNTILLTTVGSSVSALAMDPRNPSTLYASSNRCCPEAVVYKSTDGGRSWVSSPSLPGAIDLFATAPSNPAIIYAAGLSNALFKSTDGGNTWSALRRTSLPALNEFYALSVDPKNPDTVYAAGRPVSAPWDFVWKSNDGGDTWRPLAGYSLLGSGALSLAVDPRNPAVLYVGGSSSPDAFVAKVNSTGSALLYSTYLGGSAGDWGSSIAIDVAGNAYVAGLTGSANFPIVNPLPETFEGRRAFLARLNPAGSRLAYSTYIPGDGTAHVAPDPSGGVYVENRPLIARVAEDPPEAPLLWANGVVNAATDRGLTAPRPVAPGAIVTIFGASLASGAQAAASVPLPTTLLDTSVTFNGVAAPLFSVSPTKITLQVPYEAPLVETAQVQVIRGAARTPPITVTIAKTSPGIFAVVHADGFRSISEADPARPGEFVSILSTGLGPVQPAVPSGTIPQSREGAPPSETVYRPEVRIDSYRARVTYAGLAPGFVGMYQVNVQLPSELDRYSHNYNVYMISDGVLSNTVPMAIRY